jgi:hypothetical protein
MKIENRNTKNREVSYLIFKNIQYIRINHTDKNLIEWKHPKTKHFVNAKKFTLLEDIFLEGRANNKKVFEEIALNKNLPIVNSVSIIAISPVKKKLIKKSLDSVHLEID